MFLEDTFFFTLLNIFEATRSKCLYFDKKESLLFFKNPNCQFISIMFRLRRSACHTNFSFFFLPKKFSGLLNLFFSVYSMDSVIFTKDWQFNRQAIYMASDRLSPIRLCGLCQALGQCRWGKKANEKRKKRESGALFFSIRFPYYLGAWKRLNRAVRLRNLIILIIFIGEVVLKTLP